MKKLILLVLLVIGLTPTLKNRQLSMSIGTISYAQSNGGGGEVNVCAIRYTKEEDYTVAGGSVQDIYQCSIQVDCDTQQPQIDAQEDCTGPDETFTPDPPYGGDPGGGGPGGDPGGGTGGGGDGGGGNPGGGQNGDYTDCNGVKNGYAYKDNCGECVGGNTGLTPRLWYGDADGDGWGNTNNTAYCVNPGSQYVLLGGDHNDGCYNVANDTTQCVVPTCASATPPVIAVTQVSASAGNTLSYIQAHHSSCVYGVTSPESINLTINCCTDGHVWTAYLEEVLGKYSQEVSLAGGTEVTGPSGGNTTSANFCDQLNDLNMLGNCPGRWYMLAAVQAHENVHSGHLEPALIQATPDIQVLVQACTVADIGQGQATALSSIIANNPSLTIDAFNKWTAKFSILTGSDETVYCPAAEHGVVDPEISIICNWAHANSWGTCSVCP